MGITRTELAGITRLDLKLAGQSYPIFLGSGAIRPFAQYLNQSEEHKSAVLMMDENTAELFGLPFEAGLITEGFIIEPLTIAAGDQSKSLATAGQVLELLAEINVERDGLLISLGGGMISDLGGFVAALYMRGIDFAQISTSLLSMVDASVGGKTAVNLSSGKNLVGAFKQPLAIAMDLDVLDALPEEEFASGMAEIIKTAVLEGDEFLSWIEDNAENIANREHEALLEMIARCIEYKASIVEDDPYEKGKRAWLNLGHTLGHALEKVFGFGEVSHGHAVAEGLRFALRMSADLKAFPLADVKRVETLLDYYGLFALQADYEPSELMEAMRSDKKVKSGEIRFVLLSALGEVELEIVEEMKTYDHLRAWARNRKVVEKLEQTESTFAQSEQVGESETLEQAELSEQEGEGENE